MACGIDLTMDGAVVQASAEVIALDINATNHDVSFRFVDMSASAMDRIGGYVANVEP